jgi:hypothetical protein
MRIFASTFCDAGDGNGDRTYPKDHAKAHFTPTASKSIRRDTPHQSCERSGLRDYRVGQRNSPHFSGTAIPPVKLVLLDPCAATLNQNDQNDDKKHACDDPDNHGASHYKSSFSE